MKIEVGMLVMLKPDGKRVTNDKQEIAWAQSRYLNYIGRVTQRARSNPLEWEVEGVVDRRGYPYAVRESQMHPLPGEFTPAESEWQEDFKRLLNREKVS